METVNDIDERLMTFWRVLRERTEELERVCARTPHSRAELDAARGDLSGLDDVEVARRVWVALTQSRTGTRLPAGWRHFINPKGSSFGMPGYLNAYVDRMPAAAERLCGVSLECGPALDLIDHYGQCPDVLIYADPPYLGSTRRSGGYPHDMPTDDDHIALSVALRACHAAVVLSGYASSLYNELYPDWHVTRINTSTGQGGNNQGRTEVLWSNRPPTPTLFD
jgi:DNA adenine methylase